MAFFESFNLSELAKEALIPVATFTLGTASVLIGKWFSIARQRTRFAYAKEFKTPYDAAWIVDSAVPEFEVDKKSIRYTGQRPQISIPEHARDLLQRQPKKHKETEFYMGPDLLLDFESWLHIEEKTGIRNLEERVARHRKIAADDALAGDNGFHFNSKKIGVSNIDHLRVGNEEVSYLSLKSFQTDYFSHRVMQGVIREWLKEDKSILPALRDNEKLIFKKYYMFCTSLGMNVFVLDKWQDSLTLIRRSKKTADGETAAGKIHVTMNEGFSSIDFDHGRMGRGFITVNKCFRRGMEEELGIDRSSRHLSPIHVFDIFFVPDLFQFGLFGWAVYEGDWFDMKFARAQDRPLEVREVLNYKFDRDTIKNLTAGNEMVPYAAVGIEQLSRIFGILTPEMNSVGANYYFTLVKYLYRGLWSKARD